MSYNIYIGFDTREKIASDICEFSLRENSNLDLKINYLKKNELIKKGIYTREVDKLSSTEFTFTRFLVPYLSNYKGWAVFCDCDFLWLEDVKQVFDLANNKFALMCVHHDYYPKSKSKMDGQAQLHYPRKNWSSMILWNCSHPSNKKLTPELVNTQTGKFLHRFAWLEDKEIGAIDHHWNWLVNWYKEPRDGKPKAIHYTEGGPWFKEVKESDYFDLWISYANEVNKNWKKI